MYVTLQFTPYRSLAILLSMFSSVSVDVISVRVLECVCVLYLMNERLLYSFTLKVSQAALTYYISICRTVAAANTEDSGRKGLYCFTRETFCFTSRMVA